METILDMKKVVLSSVSFRLLTTDVAWEMFLLFMLDNFIGIHRILGITITQVL